MKLKISKEQFHETQALSLKIMKIKLDTFPSDQY